MIEKFVRAFLVIFILVALAMIVTTILGFSVQVEEFLKKPRSNALPNHGEFWCLYQNAFHGVVDPRGPFGFYVVIRLLGVRESRREKVEREKRAAENLNQYQQAFRERMKKY